MEKPGEELKKKPDHDGIRIFRCDLINPDDFDAAWII